MNWKEIVKDEQNLAYYKKLSRYLSNRTKEGVNIYPERKDVLKALQLTPFKKTKVVILGQDPYHGAGQAHGLSFSVPMGVKRPPSLNNIYKELESDLGEKPWEHGELTSWAHQGVLLLNSCLTVEAGKPGSHSGMGWERFTGRLIWELTKHRRSVVWMLWGEKLKATFQQFANPVPHQLILKAAHPSPYSAIMDSLVVDTFRSAINYWRD